MELTCAASSAAALAAGLAAKLAKASLTVVHANDTCQLSGEGVPSLADGWAISFYILSQAGLDALTSGANGLTAAQIDQWRPLCEDADALSCAVSSVTTPFLVGDSQTLADIVVWASLTAAGKGSGKWFNSISKLPDFKAAASQAASAAAPPAAKRTDKPPGAVAPVTTDEAPAKPMSKSAEKKALRLAAAAKKKAETAARLAAEKAERAAKGGGAKKAKVKEASLPKEDLTTKVLVEGPAPKEIEDEPFYVTTAINYTNGKPHMGHAYEAVVADVIARYHRRYGRPTYFLTGSDEHGAKIAESAEKIGKQPIDVCNDYSGQFQALNKMLKVTNDWYVRTTMPEHKELAQLMWKRATDSGDIFLGDYEGWYDVKEEAYVTETEAAKTNYLSPASGLKYTWLKEPCYYFRMSKYRSALIKHFKENPEFCQPEVLRNNLLRKLEGEELRDLSTSRSTFSWGVPVPGDPEHVMYVWFDALSNYLTGLRDFAESGPRTKKFWPAGVQIIGKDIVWFHCVIWPCMLMSVGVELPKSVFAHGFVLSADGKKMSKSLGNVVDPVGILEKVPADTFRYYLMSSAICGKDLPFSQQGLVNTHNGELVKILSNFVNRVCKLVAKKGGLVPDVGTAKVDKIFNLDAIRSSIDRYMSSALSGDGPSTPPTPTPDAGDSASAEAAASESGRSGFRLQEASIAAMSMVRDLNKYLVEKEPWKAPLKDDPAAVMVCYRSILEATYAAAHFLEPFIPDTAQRIFATLGVKPTTIAALSPEFDNLPVGAKVSPSFDFFQFTNDMQRLDTSTGQAAFQAAEDEKAKRREEMERSKAAKLQRQKEAQAAQQTKQTGASPAAAAAKEAPAQAAPVAKGKTKGKDKASAKAKKGPPPADQPLFTKIDIRVGQIVKVWPHPEGEKLWCEMVECGESEPRPILSGLREHYSEEEMMGRRILVICNLKPRKLKGIPSHGMVLCAKRANSDGSETVEFVDPPADAAVGDRIRAEGVDEAGEMEPCSANLVQKKKVWESIAPLLASNDAGVACFDGKPLKTPAGVCTAPTLKGAPIS